MRKQVPIPADLHRKVKSRAALLDMNLREFVVLAIERFLKDPESKPRTAGLAESGPAVATR